MTAHVLSHLVCFHVDIQIRFSVEYFCANATCKRFHLAQAMQRCLMSLHVTLVGIPLAADVTLVLPTAACRLRVLSVVVSADRWLVAERHVTYLTLNTSRCRPKLKQYKQTKNITDSYSCAYLLSHFPNDSGSRIFNPRSEQIRIGRIRGRSKQNACKANTWISMNVNTLQLYVVRRCPRSLYRLRQLWRKHESINEPSYFGDYYRLLPVFQT